MLTQRIFDWAKRTPDKPALIGADYVWTYADFTDAIACARGYFIRQGILGPGVASIAIESIATVWVLGFALRSLGVTVMTRGFDAADAPLLRCVVKSAREEIPNLEALCAAAGAPLLDVSLDDEAAVGLDQGPQVARPGARSCTLRGQPASTRKC